MKDGTESWDVHGLMRNTTYQRNGRRQQLVAEKENHMHTYLLRVFLSK